MKFEKLKRLYDFINEMGCEVIIEVQNIPVTCKLVNYPDIGEKIKHLQSEYSTFVLFEPVFHYGSHYILIDSNETIFYHSKKNKKIVIAENLNDFFSKFKISFQYLPKFSDILKKKGHPSLYLDEKYSSGDLPRLLEEALKKARSLFELKLIPSSENDKPIFIELIFGDKKGTIDFNLTEGSFSEYLDNKLNPYINQELDCNFKFAIVHENSWDSMVKIVFVNPTDYDNLQKANLMMEDVNLVVN